MYINIGMLWRKHIRCFHIFEYNGNNLWHSYRLICGFHSCLCSTSSVVQLKTTDAWTPGQNLPVYPTVPHMNYIQWAGKWVPPNSVPVLFNYAERTKYMLLLWCCPGGCWQVAYKLIWENKGTFCSYCGSLDPGLHRNTTIFKLPHSTTTASISWLISIQFSLKT